MFNFSAEQDAALRKRIVRMHVFVKIDLGSEVVRVWDGQGSQIADAQTWIGASEIGAIEGLETDDAIRSSGITLSLSGIPSDSIDAGVVERTRAVAYKGKALDVYYGVFNVDTGAVIGALIPVWGGFCDVMTFSYGETFSCVLPAERYDSVMRRTNGARMTTASHNQRLGNATPVDLFFDAQNRLMGATKAALK